MHHKRCTQKEETVACQHSSPNVVPHPVIQVPNCEKKESHLQLRVKRPTPPHTTRSQIQHQKPELCSSMELFRPSFGHNVHHDLLSLLCFDIKLGHDCRDGHKCASELHPSSVPPSHVSLGGRRDPWIKTRLQQGNTMALMNTTRTILSMFFISIVNWTSAHFIITFNKREERIFLIETKGK